MTDLSGTQDRRNLRRWGSVLFVLILLGFCSLFVLLIYRPAAASEVLPISIQSNRMADYSAGKLLSTPLPVISLGIISDVIKDREVSEDPEVPEDSESTDIPARLETIQVILLTPVFTVTPSPTPTPTVFGAPTQDFTQTLPANTPLPTKTSAGPTLTSPSATAALTSPPTNLPATGTAVDTSTADPTKKTPTRHPTDKPTGTDVFTAIPVNTSTWTPTSTPTYTHTATQIPSRTPIWTPTRTPTNTPTSTAAAVCSPPDQEMGFVVSTTPRDGSENVSLYTNVYIRFNQAMYQTDLFRNIKISDTNADYVMSYDSKTFVLKIDFLERLENGTTVTISVKRNTKNSCGQRQGIEVKFDFDTIEN